MNLDDQMVAEAPTFDALPLSEDVRRALDEITRAGAQIVERVT